MKCDDVVDRLPLLQYGELSFDEEEALEQHLHQCASCRAERESLAKFHAAIDDAEPSLPAGLLGDCRRRLRVGIAAVNEVAPPSRRMRWTSLNEILSGSWASWLKPAGAFALVAIGFFGARLVPEPAREPETAPIAAATPRELPMASRIRFVEPGEDGRVRIVLEETRQRVLSGATTDNDIRSLLLSAVRESSDPGLRVESADLLGSDPDSDEVREALLHALLNDPNPGVRLKALDGLRESAADPETRKTLARVLLEDENPGVRTQAIDLLIQHKQPEVVGVLQEALRRDSNNYVRLKCQKALYDMRASAESF